MSQPPPPQVSPDGKFYWDGEAWRPMQATAPATPEPTRDIDALRKLKGTMGTPVTNQPQLVLIGKGAELGHADLPLGRRKAGEEAAEWINELLGRHRLTLDIVPDTLYRYNVKEIDVRWTRNYARSQRRRTHKVGTGR